MILGTWTHLWQDYVKNNDVTTIADAFVTSAGEVNGFLHIPQWCHLLVFNMKI